LFWFWREVVEDGISRVHHDAGDGIQEVPTQVFLRDERVLINEGGRPEKHLEKNVPDVTKILKTHIERHDKERGAEDERDEENNEVEKYESAPGELGPGNEEKDEKRHEGDKESPE